MAATDRSGEGREQVEVEKKTGWNNYLCPPSPFLKGWQSVNPKDYPYFIPTPQQQQTAQVQNQSQAPAQTPIPASITKDPRLLPTSLASNNPAAAETQQPNLGQTEPTQNVTQATNPTQNQRNSKPEPKLNTDVLFLKPQRKPMLQNSGRALNTCPAAEAIKPLFQPPSQPIPMEVEKENDPEDPFADWGSPKEAQAATAPSRGKKRNFLRVESDDEDSLGAELEAKTEPQFEELLKPLKLDRNLLEIIIRTVIIKIKLLDSRKIHQETVGTLDRFKNLTIGLNPNHAKLYEEKLSEAVGKVRLIQSEFDKVTETIGDELKSSIEDSVTKHREILHSLTLDPKGLFSDHWKPKQVQYVEAMAPPSNHDVNPTSSAREDYGVGASNDINATSVETTKPTKEADAWDSWGDDTANQASNPEPPPPANPSECPWGSDEPAESKTADKPQAESKGNSDDPFGWGDANDSSKPSAGDAWGASSKSNADQGGWGNPASTSNNGAATGFGGQDGGWGARSTGSDSQSQDGIGRAHV